MSSLKKFLTMTAAMVAMSGGVDCYDETPKRVKCIKSLTPSEVAAKSKRKKKNRAVKKAKIASRKHK